MIENKREIESDRQTDRQTGWKEEETRERQYKINFVCVFVGERLRLRERERGRRRERERKTEIERQR